MPSAVATLKGIHFFGLELQRVGFVINPDDGGSGDTKVHQGLIHHLDLGFKARMRGIDHVEEQISFARFVQGALKDSTK